MMLGTFSPQKEPYTYQLEEETTPSGIFARGSYSARTKVKKKHHRKMLQNCLLTFIRFNTDERTKIVFLDLFQFVDDDGKVYLDISYFFEIRKDWA